MEHIKLLNNKIREHISFEQSFSEIYDKILSIIANRYYNGNYHKMIDDYKFKYKITFNHYNVATVYNNFIETVVNEAISRKLCMVNDYQFVTFSVSEEIVSTPYDDYTKYHCTFDIKMRDFAKFLFKDTIDVEYINNKLYYRNVTEENIDYINRIENLLLQIYQEIHELNKIIKEI